MKETNDIMKKINPITLKNLVNPLKKRYGYKDLYPKVTNRLKAVDYFINSRSLDDLEKDLQKVKFAKKLNAMTVNMNPMVIVLTGIVAIFSLGNITGSLSGGSLIINILYWIGIVLYLFYGFTR